MFKIKYLQRTITESDAEENYPELYELLSGATTDRIDITFDEAPSDYTHPEAHKLAAELKELKFVVPGTLRIEESYSEDEGENVIMITQDMPN